MAEVLIMHPIKGTVTRRRDGMVEIRTVGGSILEAECSLPLGTAILIIYDYTRRKVVRVEKDIGITEPMFRNIKFSEIKEEEEVMPNELINIDIHEDIPLCSDDFYMESLEPPPPDILELWKEDF